jgi:fibronectin type 3 domain-containing protein
MTENAAVAVEYVNNFMKTFLCILMLAISSFLVGAASVTLAWDPSPDTNVVAYKIYLGPTSGSYTNNVSVGNVTNATLTNLVAGAIYYFAATAVDTNSLESDFSNEIIYTAQLAVPMPLNLRIVKAP